ncbi:MAG TPA: cation:proton antiporter [Dokdonella sp.]
MTFLGWVAAAGSLLLVMAMLQGLLARLPIATSQIYLVIGLAVGPLGLGWIRLDVVESAHWIERIAELGVSASLFFGALKLRLRLRNPAWRPAYRLALPAMLLSILGVALVVRLLLGLDWPHALLIGAILAPTDPVLAGMVTVDDASDHDSVRYALSGEAGLNDGMAFPFVKLALLLLDGSGGVATWVWQELIWSVAGGLVIGFAIGRVAGLAAIRMHSRFGDASAPSDFLALALIALAYTAAQSLHALGFLAVFAAGLGLRRSELTTSRRSPLTDSSPQRPPPPADELVNPNRVTEKDLDQPAVAAGVILAEAQNFGTTVERLMEVALLVLIGVAIASVWDVRGVAVAAALFVLIRPASVALALIGTPLDARRRALIAWLGIRGIGSLYYLAYALQRGVGGEPAELLTGVTMTVIALSVSVHGITAQPLLGAYRRRVAA